jgi:hypothetical protein
MINDNETKAALAAIQSEYDEAKASSVGKAPWPEEGLSSNYVTGITIDTDGTFRQPDPHPDLPALVISWSYELADDPNREEPLKWRGTPFFIPKDPSQLSNEKSKTRYRIELERLKGQVQAMLSGKATGNLMKDLEACEAMINGDTAVLANVYVKLGDYRKEGIKEILSGKL